jgi:hypothetical protein
MQDATANELKAFDSNPELASLTSSVGKRLVSLCGRQPAWTPADIWCLLVPVTLRRRQLLAEMLASISTARLPRVSACLQWMLHALHQGHLLLSSLGACACMQGISNLVDALSTQLTSMLLQDLPDMIKKVGGSLGRLHQHICRLLPAHMQARGSGTRYHCRHWCLVVP